jgi:hypothetical protein
LAESSETTRGPARWPGIEKAASVPTETIGGTGSVNAGGYVWSEERNPALAGDRRYGTYDEMVRDTAIVGAGVRLFLNLIANAEWSINPAEDQEDDPRAQEIADLAYDIIFDMTTSWSSVVRKIATYRFQGFSVLEWTAKRRDDGQIGLLDIEMRPQRTIARWNQDRSGTVESVFQNLPGGEVELPRSKIVYAVDDTLTENPEGLGLYRHLVASNERLKGFLDLEQMGFETDLRGIPVARAPLGELRAEVEKESAGDARIKAEARRTGMLKPLKDFITNHIRNRKTGLLLPSDTYTTLSPDTKTATSTPKWGLELVNGDSQAFDAIAKAIDRVIQELARVLGVEHLLLGANGAGSLALAQSKVGTFYLTVKSTLSDILEIIERDILQPLADLNGWPPELVPSAGVSEIREQDIVAVTTALQQMAMAGATLTPDDPAVGEVRDQLGLSRAPQDLVDRELDASLNPTRNDPTGQGGGGQGDADPTKPLADNPEDQVRKARMNRTRRGDRRVKAAILKRAA